MALKIKFLDGTSKEFTDDEIASINQRLDKVLSPDFGKGMASQMIADSIEMNRLGEALDRGTFSREERQSVEKDFYSLTKKIREDSQSFWRKKRLADAALSSDKGQIARSLAGKFLGQASPETDVQPRSPKLTSSKEGQLKYTKLERTTDSEQRLDMSRSLAGEALRQAGRGPTGSFVQIETASSSSVLRSRVAEKFGAPEHDDGDKETPKRKRDRDTDNSMDGP
ncbi:hypothetical protein N0U25_09345 [Pseudomonas sivasensis]|uniref:hypothetical protein n=1 Tax=Pseudomonas sivasensis TaxID=1880678 RepID=UPI0021A9B988|nr:hypothetical protein [Pseudomonas sivasensis]MCT4497995.1 hypothetical protein [Pseudomonas sivasensis]